MPQMKTKRRVLFLATAIVIVLSCASCGTGLQRSETTGSDWSRGVLVGETSNAENVQLALTTQDSPILAWVDISTGTKQIRIQTLDKSGTPLADYVVASPNAPSQLTLIPAGNDQFHLVWVSGQTDLMYALVSVDGTIRAEQTLAEGITDLTCATVPLDEGAVALLWSGKVQDTASLFYSALSAQGTLRMAPTDLGIEASDIAAALANDGSIQVVWYSSPELSRRNVNYGIINAQTGDLEQSSVLTMFAISTGLVARAPAIAIEDESVYVFWTRERRGGGLTSPMAETFYAWFPIGDPANATTGQVELPTTREPVYTVAESALGLDTAPLEGDISGSSFCYFPNTLQTSQEPVYIAFSVQQVGRTTEIIQIITSVWQNGAPVSYQVAARTTTTSQKPTLAVDSQDDWHLAWIDIGTSSIHQVYYASTSAEAVAYLNKLSLGDIGETVADVIWGLIQSLSFLPMAVVWLFPGLVLISIYMLISAEGDLERSGPRIVLIVSGVLYIVTKYIFRPSWLLDLPVPAFISATMADKIVLFSPAALALLAGVFTAWYVHRKSSASLLAGFAIFALSDAVLTMLLYVPGIFAE